jgi:hypothetical protein
VRTYPETISCSSVDPAPSADSIDGSATLTFDRSRIVSPATATHTQNARHRWGEVSTMSVVGGCAERLDATVASSVGGTAADCPEGVEGVRSGIGTPD